MSDTDFESFLLATYGAMFNNAKEGAAIYVCHADGSSVSFRQQFINAGWMLKQILIWAKDNFTLSRQDYNWQHEPIIYGWKPGAAHNWYGPFNDSTVLDFKTDLSKKSKQELLDLITVAKEVSTVINEPRPRRNEEHPTMKPINLITRLVGNSAKRGDLILDPFGGSGSTMMAAHTLGMKAALVELDPIYADVICRRWQQATGVLPINEATGNTYDFVKSENVESTETE
jgi:DNA modification methylase